MTLVVAFGLSAGSAGAATPISPAFAGGLGSVLPTAGAVTQVSVSCPDRGGGVCRGSVALIPRGQTAQELGSGALATKAFELKGGADDDLRLRLDSATSRRLADGPLFVTAVLRSAGASKPVAERRVAVAHEHLYSPSAVPTASRVATASDATTFSWEYNLRPGTAVALKPFSCPPNAPRVAAGRSRTRPARFMGRPVEITEYAGKMVASGGDGTGYAGFDHPNLHTVPGGIVEGIERRDWTYMTGWDKGDLFHNSVWAPLFKPGRFSLTVTCAAGEGGSTARMAGLLDPETQHAKEFFPWKW